MSSNFESEYSCECKEICNCGEQEDPCLRWVEKNVSISAAISVSPHVELYEPDIHCCGPAKLHKREARPSNTCYTEAEPCTFYIEQLLHVRIPLKFGADVSSETLGIVCHPDKEHGCRDNDHWCECDDDFDY